jgi:tRNA threonylcarbamoyladenosine biosynthesis protein TsaE
MARNLQIETSSEAETIRVGAEIGKALRPLDVVLLIGNLGTGKTRLAKGMISAAAGVDPNEVASPTFTLVNRFDGTFPVFHADLYRLEGVGLEDIGLDEALEAGGALIVEWAESILDLDPDPLLIFMDYGTAPHVRSIRVEWRSGGRWEERIPGCVRSFQRSCDESSQTQSGRICGVPTREEPLAP